jgi:hypothetical protein
MTRTSRSARAGAIAVAATALVCGFPAAGGTLPFDVAHRIALPGGSPVAALSFAPDGKRAYAAVGDELRSFDVATGAPAGILKLPGRVTALATSSDAGGSLYAALGGPARLLLVGLHPMRIRSSMPVRGGTPSGLLYVPGEDAIYIESRSGHSAARLDADGGKTIAVAHLQGNLEQMAGDGRGTLYIANATSDAVDVLATGKMTVTGAIPTPNCHAPTGLALDPVGRRLFVACANATALVIDTDMGFAFEQLPIQKSAALRTVFAFHPNGLGGWKGGVFIAGDGPMLDAIRMNAFISYTGAGSMPLRGRTTALAVSPAVGQLWIALAPLSPAPGRGGSADAVGQLAGVEILALGASGGAP